MNKQVYCFFSAQYLPTAGGVERYTYNLARELRRRGHDVVVVTSSLPGLPAEETDPHGIRVFRVESLPVSGGRLPVVRSPRAWRSVSKALDGIPITRIVVQTRLYVLSILGMRYARKRSIPMIAIEHGTSYIGIGNPLMRAAVHTYEKTLLFFAKRLCRTFCAVSHAGEEWLETLGIRSRAVLYNSVDDAEVARKLESVDLTFREAWGLTDDAKIVTFVGRLIPEKGIVQLTEAVRRIRAGDGSVVLCVAGNGPLYDSLCAVGDPGVRMLGQLPHDQVLTLLAQSSVFCLPSDSEGFPTGVLEAVLCRCYVVTTCFGGAKELIAGPEYGTVIGDNRTQTIEAALRSVLSDPVGRAAAAERAYHRFYQGFTWQKTCDTLEALDWGAL